MSSGSSSTGSYRSLALATAFKFCDPTGRYESRFTQLKYFINNNNIINYTNIIFINFINSRKKNKFYLFKTNCYTFCFLETNI